ncbi:PrsW family intramembrane metalloprotease [Streptomyces sp. NPDC002514]
MGGQIGVTGVTAGLVVSALAAVPVAGAFLWLGRWKRERSGRLLSAFVWGASLAAFAAIWSEEALQHLADTAVSTDFGHWFRPLVITPVAEEVLKSLFVLWVVIYQARWLTGLLDGIVYAGLVGTGFACTENTLYLGKAVTTFATDVSDPHAAGRLAATVFLRMVMLPFFHPLMVIVSASGIAAVVRERGRSARAGLALGAPLIAIALHGAWDWAGLASGDPFLIYKIYGGILVPAFLTMLILALVLRRRAGKMVAASLPALARDGHIDPSEVTPLSHLGQRRRWRKAVLRHSGRGAAQATTRYQAEASGLSIRTTRAQATGHGDGLDEQVRTVAAARSDMLGAIAASQGSVRRAAVSHTGR